MGNFNGLQQPPYNTSLMGVVKGALDHYGSDARPAEAFVLSGHAFVVNIHEELCPSAPYCWNSTRFFELLGNLGLGVRQLGMALPNAPDSEKAALEATVREALARGSVCSLLNLDNQLILGHDADGFRLAQPWGDVESTPARLSYGSWREFQAGPPLTFFEFRQSEASVNGSAVFDALDFALAIWREPQRFAEAGYGMGPDAYANWIAAIDAGHGDDHGAWWNGMVWAECREQAGDYFQSLAAAEFPGAIDQQQARLLALGYRNAAKLLYRAADKTADAAAKRRFVLEARDAEADCIAGMEKLRA